MQRHHDVAGKSRHLNSWKKDKIDARDKHFKVSFLKLLPREADLRTSPLIPRVEDQGEIGSCTCNSSTSGMEFALKKEGKDLQFSRLWLYAKVRQFEGTPLSEDSGAEIRDVMKVLAAQGCPEERFYPYNPQHFTMEPPATLAPEAVKHKITVYYRCPSLRTIKASIAAGFPVVGGFQVPSSMMSAECARTGIVKLPTPSQKIEGGHAVLFCGYVYIAGVLYLVFQNSWGAGWGAGGFGFLDARYVTQGLADDFWTQRLVML